MKAMTISEYAEVLQFIQKHHQFYYVPEKDLVTKHSYSIKYIDCTYDTRFSDIWCIKFRGRYDYRFAVNTFSFPGAEPDNNIPDSLFEWVMKWLKGEWEPDEDVKKLLKNQ
jgi:hypothetical protein